VAHDVSLQINLSGGDVAYATTTVPRLVAAHRKNVSEVFLVVDCVRPQRTQMIDPDVKFPPEQFQARVDRIREIAEGFLSQGVVDRVVFVNEGDPRIRQLLRKYVGWPIHETHDCYGVGLVSYLYGFDEALTRFLLHYDADMLLYQAPGYDWVLQGRDVLLSDTSGIAATPRVSPPFADQLQRQDSISLHESDAYSEARDGYWRIGWFSARCFLIDLERLRLWLPLLGWRDPAYLAEILARRWLVRGYPPPTEVLVHRRAERTKAFRLDLMTQRCFVLHPNDKSDRFLALLPRISDAVADGVVPDAQRGMENILVDEWAAFFACEPTSA
jgi:hypothetical protein